MKCGICNSDVKVARENYPYAEIEVPNVVLGNVEVRRCSNGHHEVVIPKMAALHRQIALEMAGQATRLTGAEFRFLRKHLGYASKEFAEVIGIDPATLSRWENDPAHEPNQAAEVAIREMVKSGRKAAEYEGPPKRGAPARILMEHDNGWHKQNEAA